MTKQTNTRPNRRPSKTALVLGLLGRPEGATIAQLVTAAGWLALTCARPRSVAPAHAMAE